jgi:membrane peptidoglycan carboxypeptidase
MLKDVVRNGTASRLKVGRPVAAKTGTTSDNRDAYLVAYTPDLVVSFWMGHDMQKLGMIQGGSGATIVFMNHLITQLKGDDSPVDFERPSDISGPVSICSKSGLRPGENCPSGTIVSEIFPTHLLPQKDCNLHVKIEVCAVSGLLPGEFCPEHEIENIFFLNRPVFEITDHRWRGGAGRGPVDAGLIHPEETCNVHMKILSSPLGFSAYLLYNPPRVHLLWIKDFEITEYQIYRKAAGEEDFTHLNTLAGSEDQFLDNDLSEGKEYTYRLFAYNKEGVQSEPAIWSMELSPTIDEDDNSSAEKPQPPDGEEKVNEEDRAEP